VELRSVAGALVPTLGGPGTEGIAATALSAGGDWASLEATKTGVVDLPTPDVVRGYRVSAESTEPLPLGVRGDVPEPGSVAPGDLVERRA
jgi:hypothetical protein